METININSKLSHDDLVASAWFNVNNFDSQEHHVYFVEHGSLYLLANYETGIVDISLTFDDFNDLVAELQTGGWEQL